MGDASRVHPVSNQVQRCSCSNESLLRHVFSGTSSLGVLSDTQPIHLVVPPGAFGSIFEDADQACAVSTSPRPRALSLQYEHPQREETAGPYLRHTESTPNFRVPMVANQEQKNTVEALLHSQSVCHLELQAPREFFHVVRSFDSIGARQTNSVILDARKAEDFFPDLFRTTFPCVNFLVLILRARPSQLVDAIRSYISYRLTNIYKLSVAFHPLPLVFDPSPDDNALVLSDAPESLPRTLASATPIVLVTLSSGLRLCHVQMECSEECACARDHGGDLAGRILQAAPMKALSIQLDIRHSAFEAISALLLPLYTVERPDSQLDSLDINIIVDNVSAFTINMDESWELVTSIVSRKVNAKGIFNFGLTSNCTHTAESQCNWSVVYAELRRHHQSMSANVPNRRVKFVVSTPCALSQTLCLPLRHSFGLRTSE